MRIITDLHIHSKYSRACSKDLDLEHNAAWAKRKGITIVGTGDFTHPAWFRELKEKLVEAKPGLFKLRAQKSDVYFMLTTELSCIYSQGGKVRRVHICVFAPSFSAVEKIIAALEARKVNLRADGRPIMGLSVELLTKIIYDCDPRCMVIPAHIWTPWFAMFGSHSGFDTVQECFGEMTPNICAIETGLSSDPPMNWRLSALDDMMIVSNSDAHSPANLGREATVFDIAEEKLSYDEWRRILFERDRAKLLYTIEFFPEEGKYHADGHRACHFYCLPAETKKLKNICPVCKRNLTVGVLHRVEDLADREVHTLPVQHRPYKSIIPLPELIAAVIGKGKGSKAVQTRYLDMTDRCGSEFYILLDAPQEHLLRFIEPEIVAAIETVRQGKVRLVPGYDGEYGVIDALGINDLPKQQKTLF